MLLQMMPTLPMLFIVAVNVNFGMAPKLWNPAGKRGGKTLLMDLHGRPDDETRLALQENDLLFQVNASSQVSTSSPEL